METDENDYQNQEILEIAKKRVTKLKSFYKNSFIYIIAVTIYILKTYFGFPFVLFPIPFINTFIMAIWTIIFLISAIELVVINKVFGKKWENQKIRKMIEKKSKKIIWK